MTTLIKTFSNGSALTARWQDGNCRLEVDGVYGALNPLVTPISHPVAGVLVANVLSGGKNYMLSQADMDRLNAFEATRVATLTDRASRIALLVASLADAKAVVGSAWTASIEHARIHGSRPDTAQAEAAERNAVLAAEKDLADAKAADPEAFAAYEADRARMLESAMQA